MWIELVPPQDRPALPTFFCHLFYFVVWFAVALPPSRFRVPLSLPIIVALALNALKYSPGEVFVDAWGSGPWISSLILRWFDLVLLNNADKEQFHKLSEEEKRTGEINGKAPTRFLQRLKWAALVLIWPRGVGWSWEVKNVPPSLPAGYSRWKFCLRHGLRASLFFVLDNTIQIYLASTPYGRELGSDKPLLGFSSESFSWRAWYMWLFICAGYYRINSATSVAYILFVATRTYKPEECPPIMNDLRTMTTLRNAWSLTWHQNIRRSASAIGIWLARDVFKFPKGTFKSKYTQLFAGFAVSGLIHWYVSLWANPVANGHDIGDMNFFMAQAVAILVEDHVIDLGKKLGLGGSQNWKFVGYLWVILWFSWSLQLWMAPDPENVTWWINRPGIDFFGLRKYLLRQGVVF